MEAMIEIPSYPAVFEKQEDGMYCVNFPDLNDLATFGTDYNDAMKMAVDAMAGYLYDLKREGEAYPQASDPASFDLEGNEFIGMVSVDVEEYAKRVFNKAVKKTVTIPKWMSDAARENGLKLSRLLQQAIRQELGL